MDENAALGPIDPQLMQQNEGPYPAPSILAVVKQKGADKVEDKTLLLADVAEKSLRQVRGFLTWLLTEVVLPDRAEEVAAALTDGRPAPVGPGGAHRHAAGGVPADGDLPSADAPAARGGVPAAPGAGAGGPPAGQTVAGTLRNFHVSGRAGHGSGGSRMGIAGPGRKQRVSDRGQN